MPHSLATSGTMPTVIQITALIYLCGMCVLALGVAWRRKTRRNHFRPSVSIIIAARNEEGNIGRCLDSIAAVRYPEGLLEVIVVDDHSTDRTAGIISEFGSHHPSIRLVKAGEPDGHLRGKVNALTHGIEQSTGEVLLFTDADCIVPPSWVESLIRYYDSDDVGIVAGFLSLPAHSVFEAVQALDWYMLLSAASATARIRFPVTAVGNNFSVRRAAYERTGGYRKIPFCVTEDLSLFQAVVAAGYRGVIPPDPGSAVETAPCRSWGELFAQRRRWFVGGKHAPSSRVAAFSVAYACNFFAVAGWLFLDLPLWGEIVLLKVFADLLLLLPIVGTMKRLTLVRYWLLFEPYLTLYIVVLPLLAIFAPRISWKQRTF